MFAHHFESSLYHTTHTESHDYMATPYSHMIYACEGPVI